MRRALRWSVLRSRERLASLVAVVLLCILAPGESAAQKLAALPKSSPGLVSWRTTKPIPAWNDFCQRHPRECLVDLAEPSTITLTKATWNAILEVNRRVNAAISSPPIKIIGVPSTAGICPTTATGIVRTSSFSSAGFSLIRACLAGLCA
jgi:hypothetical protein